MKDNDFILSDEIQRFANHLTYEIKSPKQRREVRQEYVDHIEDSIHHYLLKGMSEHEAFRRVCEEMGDTTKIQELLAVVHNKDSIPRWVKYPIIALTLFAYISSYFFIENSNFRAWYILIAQITIIASVCVLLYCLFNFYRAFRIRYKAIKELKQYAKRNGHTLQINANPYLSLFKKTTVPEIIYETSTQRYIMSLWATVKRKQTLHLTDFGFYSTSHNFGHFLLCGSFGGGLINPIAISFVGGLPKDTKWWYWIHAEITEAPPEEAKFMPQIQYEEFTNSQKENIFVLLLNPIPMKIDYVEKGVLHNGGDDAVFDGVRLWSASGFMSYMDGRIMYEKKKFKSFVFE